MTSQSDRAARYPIGVFIVIYLIAAVLAALHASLWMDEVLAIAAATQPDLRGVVHAIWIGTDFSPPTYHILLHLLPGLTAWPQIVARVPSILAVLGAGLCMHAIARPRFGPALATVTFTTTVASPLFAFAVEARQYALTTCLLAAALALWDRLSQDPDRMRLPGLWAALAAGLCLHFYAVVAVGAVILCEILWSLHHRRLRLAVWVVFAALIPVMVAWLPLSMHLRAIAHADQVAPGFYGHPVLVRLIKAIGSLTVGGENQWPTYIGLLLAIVIGAMAGARSTAAPPPRHGDANLAIVMIALATIPLATYAFGVVATGTFVARYALGVSLLPGLAITIALAGCPAPDRAARILLPFVAFSLIEQTASPPRTLIDAYARQALEQQHGAEPVMVGDGLVYLELVGSLPPAQAARITYLSAPPNLHSPDPTNENEVLRLAAFDRRFRAVPFDGAIATGRSFLYLRAGVAETDPILAEIVRRHIGQALVTEAGAAQIFRVRP